MNGQPKVVGELPGHGPAAQLPEPERSRPVVIEVSGLRKSCGDFEAVAGIEMQVRAGEVFAFLGPNGAGGCGYRGLDG